MAASFENRAADQPDLAPILIGLARRHGGSVLSERGRLQGLLRDYAPTALREIRMLLAALDAGTPGRLQSATDPLAPPLLDAEATRMVESFGCGQSFALQAIETWGRALLALRNPAVPPPVPRHSVASAAMPVSPPALPRDEDRATWLGRWGGAVIAILLVLVALVRWLGFV